jgi:predicted nucleic acid-binding protein
MRYLLDTSVISKRDTYAKARAWILAHQMQIALSAFTIGEIQRGIQRLAPGPKRRALQEFLQELLSDFPVLPFDADCATAWASYTEQAGRPVPLMDSLIASIAIANNLQLVTDNDGDFPNLDLINPLK